MLIARIARVGTTGPVVRVVEPDDPADRPYLKMLALRE